MRGTMQGSPCVFVEMWVALFSRTRESPKSAICMHPIKAQTRRHQLPIGVLDMQRTHSRVPGGRLCCCVRTSQQNGGWGFMSAPCTQSRGGPAWWASSFSAEHCRPSDRCAAGRWSAGSSSRPQCPPGTARWTAACQAQLVRGSTAEKDSRLAWGTAVWLAFCLAGPAWKPELQAHSACRCNGTNLGARCEGKPASAAPG